MTHNHHGINRAIISFQPRANEYTKVIVVFVSLICCHFLDCILDHNVTQYGPLVVYGVIVGDKMMITLVHHVLLE